ncbi:MAG: flagellar basal body-associated FliL family protein [Nitrospira sp.]|nr:flagellar basal body-associated FliL family protein [Nitrospira sp.]
MASAADDEKAEKALGSGANAISLKMVIIIVLGALILALGGAFVMFKMMVGGHEGEAAKAETGAAKVESQSDTGSKSASAETKSGTAKASGPGAMFDIEPFIVNLSDVQEVRYLKMTVKLELESQDDAAELTSRMPQVRDTILVLLTSKDSMSIRTTQGKFLLRDEITQRINGLLPKPAVRTAYFTDFVVQ